MKKYGIIIILISLLLMGCGKKEEEEILTGIPDYIEQSINDNISVDAVIYPKPQNEFYSMYHVKTKNKYDIDILNQYFFDGECPKIRLNEDTPTKGVYELSMRGNGKRLYINGYFMYSTDYYDENLSLIETLDPGSTSLVPLEFNQYPVVDELEGFPSKEAIDKAEEALKIIEYDYASDPVVCIGITADCLEMIKERPEWQEYYKINKKNVPEYTDNDEFYYMVYGLQIDANKLSLNNYRQNVTNLSALSDGGSYAVVCVGKNEIYNISTRYNFQLLSDISSEPQKIISFETAFSSICGYFNNFIFNNKVTIQKISFEYIAVRQADGSVIATPAWIGYAEEEKEPKYGMLVVVNALTGEYIQP